MHHPPRRFLALGDSYTIGEAVPAEERWPSHLRALLVNEGIGVAEPEIIATTGWTTDELLDGMAAAEPRGPYDLVSLLIGVNDQYRGLSVEGYRRRFTTLLDRAIVLGGGAAARVLVLSIPDWGVTPFAEGRDRGEIAREIDRFNAANREVAIERAVHYVDVTPVSRAAAVESELTAPDGLHPSGRMYMRWAELALEPARAALAGHPRAPEGAG